MTSTKSFRSDIQGLRALAVSLVVIFHVWPSALTGGFIGVDVFFVISGFLITKHIFTEVMETGTVSATRFWARRIRRLLPASFFVLVVILILTLALFPRHIWNQTLREIAASAIYIENWALVANSVDYLAIENEPTLVQHFWSLSVEEQFYFFWPLYIVAIVALAKPKHVKKRSLGTDANRDKKAIKYGLFAVFAISLAYSVYATENLGSGQSYFSTATRAWEFSLGGLLIHFPDSSPGFLSDLRYQIAKAVVSWIGFALIVFSAITFSSDTNFPGYIASIPVFGTAVIILSRSERVGWSFAGMTRFSPFQFLGGISYSVYLWHWPLVILSPLIFVDVSNSRLLGLMIIGTTISFSWISKKWIEDPVLRSDILVTKPRYSFMFASAGMFLVLLTVGVISKTNEQPVVGVFPKSDKPRAVGEDPKSNNSHGLDAGVLTEQFSSVEEIQQKLTETLSSDSWPEIDQKPGRHAQVPEWIVDKCNNVEVNNPESMSKCVYGNIDAEQVLVVIGDSWATHLLPAIRQAFSSNWRIQVLTLGQCPVSDVAVHLWKDKNEHIKCKQHRADTMNWIKINSPDLVISSDSPVSTASRLMSKANGVEAIQEIKEGLLKSYQVLNRFGVDVVHIESPPRITCFSERMNSPAGCKTNSSTSFQRQISEAKISIARAMNYIVIDTTFWICSSDLVCPNQIGNTLVKADLGHLTGVFSRKLGKIFRDEILNRE